MSNSNNMDIIDDRIDAHRAQRAVDRAREVADLARRAPVVPMRDRGAVVETLRRAGAVVCDGGQDYRVLLTVATRLVWESDAESDSFVPAWTANTSRFARDIFAVIDRFTTVEALDARDTGDWRQVKEARAAFYADLDLRESERRRIDAAIAAELKEKYGK